MVKDLAEQVIDKTGKVEKAQVWGDLSDENAEDFVDMLRGRNEFSKKVNRAKTKDATRLMEAARIIWLAERGNVKIPPKRKEPGK